MKQRGKINWSPIPVAMGPTMSCNGSQEKRCDRYCERYSLRWVLIPFNRYSLKVGTGTTFSGTKSGTKFKLLFLYLCEHFIKISKIKWKVDNFIYKIKSTLLQLIVFFLLIWALLSMPVLALLVPTFRGVLLVPTGPGPF